MSDTEQTIQTMMGFTPKQWAVIVVLVTGCVGTAFWVENRYAKITEINEKFTQNQQQIESAHFLTLELFSLLTEKQRRAILEKLNLAKVNKSKSAN